MNPVDHECEWREAYRRDFRIIAEIVEDAHERADLYREAGMSLLELVEEACFGGLAEAERKTLDRARMLLGVEPYDEREDREAAGDDVHQPRDGGDVDGAAPLRPAALGEGG